MDELGISGPETEELLRFITVGIDDATLDEIKIDRQFAKPSGVANEPFTTAALITLGGAAMLTVARLIEDWWDLQASKGDKELALEAYAQSSEAGKAIVDLAKVGLRVSESRKPLDPSKLLERFKK